MSFVDSQFGTTVVSDRKMFLQMQKVHLHFGTNIQERLLNKPYVNEVTLTGQNPSLKRW